MKIPCNGSWLKIFLGGLLAGGVLAAVLAWGMRVTDSRPFCASCHVMQEAAVTHKASTHAALACNECHSPANLLVKLPFKAKEGLRDVIANMQGRDAPLLPGVATRDVINENCKSCHSATNMNVASMDAKPYCTDCHRNVAHMRSKPISTRTVAHD
ncbi:NapC/NirT family cytochrome c [uncultured Desulfovibrio sp.]|uniref:Cytochrome c-type protein n=1 Tax=Candidatus Desulfovibrio intestinavium TaxID=2838534 RepID=A0A9D2HQM7_9BACT|nr:NapC/NirT family cytochrome c [uncultured Desulfovibrio sp.]HJA80033.1 NapC/NirT family cytochrome c [Candidatus Desulfovibrio intestinavium]